ncbi:MAG TPA: hypothetical protein VGL10_07575 [Gammaproteobacteria bacterium]
MDRKTEVTALPARLTWIIAVWYLFVLWSWSVPLYTRDEQVIAVLSMIILGGIVLSVISFAKFLYNNFRLTSAAAGNDFIARTLSDLGALTVLARFSVIMGRFNEESDDTALMLVAGVILLTVVYGVVRIVIGVSEIRRYLGARWRVVSTILLALAVISAWREILNALNFILFATGITGGHDDFALEENFLDLLWEDGYWFFLLLITAFLAMLISAIRQFRLLLADFSQLAAILKTRFSGPRTVGVKPTGAAVSGKSRRIPVKRNTVKAARV